MMEGKSDISICVISYERADLTEICLDSISRNTVHSYHVFLIDNGSKDSRVMDNLERWESKDSITVIRNATNHGASFARNQAIKLSGEKFRVLAMFDNDMKALPAWDIAALRAFQNGADLIQPKLLTGDGEFIERGPNRSRPEVISANPEFIGKGFEKNHPDVNQEDEVAIVGAGIFRREVFDRIGGYDERLHIGEDFDLSFRARDAGFKLRYVPDCELIHDHVYDPNYDQERARVSKYLESHVILWRKHRKVLLSPAYLHWYSWMHFNNEPMYMSEQRTLASVPRRLRRRAVRRWIMSSYPQVWPSTEEAEREVLALERKLDRKR